MDTINAFDNDLAPVNLSNDPIKLSDKALKAVYWRHYQILACFNYERQQASTYCYSMIPALLELYKDDEVALEEALKRHLEFFNTTCAMVPFVLGITCAMEEQLVNDKTNEMDPSSINAVKASLMGPLAGIGDSFFWGTFRVIGAGVGAPMAVQGNPFGPIFYFLVNFIPSTIARVGGFRLGYKGGQQFLNQVASSGTLERLTEAAKILGLIVIGGMIANMVRIATPLVFTFGETSVVLQDMFDSVLPKALPLLATFVCYWLLRKKVNSIVIMLGMLVIGLIGKLIGFF